MKRLLVVSAVTLVVSLFAGQASACWHCGDVAGRATCVSAGSTAGKTNCSSGTNCGSSFCSSQCSTSGSDCTGSDDCRTVGGELVCEENRDVAATPTPESGSGEVRTPNGAPWKSLPRADTHRDCA